MKYLLISLALCLIVSLSMVAYSRRESGPITPPTVERPVVVCGLEGVGPYPFATNEVGGRVPISEEECREWQARGGR